MPMGIVSDSEFESQLQNVNTERNKIPVVIPEIVEDDNEEQPILEGEVIEMRSKGRSIGDLNVPDSLRKLIAETAHIEGRESALAFAKEFGVSASSVSAYTKGATSTASYDKPKPDIIAFVKQRKARVTKKALKIMAGALDNITEQKLFAADAKDLSGIAKDMSAIVGHFNDPAGVTNNNTGPTFVLYSPQVMKEESFKSISAHE